jgi:hypothetical protein
MRKDCGVIEFFICPLVSFTYLKVDFFTETFFNENYINGENYVVSKVLIV